MIDPEVKWNMCPFSIYEPDQRSAWFSGFNAAVELWMKEQREQQKAKKESKPRNES